MSFIASLFLEIIFLTTHAIESSITNGNVLVSIADDSDFAAVLGSVPSVVLSTLAIHFSALCEDILSHVLVGVRL